ncbi:hypothetical protein Ddc_17022 [Ditylenchus destructor]|nr:hypothetical protein Ddc_17022 [Ditylenchus destructor]
MWYSILILFIFAPVATAPPKLPPSAAPQATSTTKTAKSSKILVPPQRKSTYAQPKAKSGSMIQMNPHTVAGEFIPLEFKEDVYKRVKENSTVSNELVGGILSNAFGVGGSIAGTVLGWYLDTLNHGCQKLEKVDRFATLLSQRELSRKS